MSQNKLTELPKFSIKQLLEAGVHFGHKTMRRNTKMSKYIFTSRNGISIIDLNKTAILLHESLKIVKEIAKNNGRILFISTKKQGIEPIAEAAKRCGQYFVNFRWLGGMLTNWKTVSQSIKTLKKIEDRLSDNEIILAKKEKLVLERKRMKLERNFGGIRNIGGSPDLIFVIDTHKESLAIAEAKKLGIPIMAILDTNCNPDGITFPIPGNDDSAKSIKLYCNLISGAIIAGIKENMAAAGVDISKFGEGELPANLTISKNNEEKKVSKFIEKTSLEAKSKHKSGESKKSAEAHNEESKKKADGKNLKTKTADAGKKTNIKPSAVKTKSNNGKTQTKKTTPNK